jgi:hypothetical protein
MAVFDFGRVLIVPLSIHDFSQNLQGFPFLFRVAISNNKLYRTLLLEICMRLQYLPAIISGDNNL